MSPYDQESAESGGLGLREVHKVSDVTPLSVSHNHLVLSHNLHSSTNVADACKIGLTLICADVLVGEAFSEVRYTLVCNFPVMNSLHNVTRNRWTLQYYFL